MNFNETTGIAFGVIAGNSLDPDLLNDLMYGVQATDLNWAQGVTEVRREAQERFDQLRRIANDNVRSEGYPDSEDEYDEACDAELERLSGGFDNSSDFIENEVDKFNDEYEADESTYIGELEGVKYKLSWLGGAIIVFVCESPHIISNALACSPCIPGAGDLDKLLDYTGHSTVQCYDVPESWRYKA